MCIVIVSIGSAIQYVCLFLKIVEDFELTLHRGWDNTGANGANLSFPVEFGIANQPWLVGVINAAYGYSLIFVKIPLF